MFAIGKYNTLPVDELCAYGAYLRYSEKGDRLLLPNSQIPEGLAVGDEIKVFVHLDSEDRLIATLETPFATADQFAFLEVKDVNRFGAFMDWGLSKDLFVPFKQQEVEFYPGDFELVYILLDDTSDRLIGIGKYRKFFNKDLSKLVEGQEVDVLVYELDQDDYRVLVDNQYNGMIFESDCMHKAERGTRMKAYIKKIRTDGKLDLTTFPSQKTGQSQSEELILQRLKDAGGELPFNAKTPADVLTRELGMSRKIFKKSIGSLYRKKLVSFSDTGMSLVKK